MAMDSTPLTGAAPAAEAVVTGAGTPGTPAPHPRRSFRPWFRETGWRDIVGVVMRSAWRNG